MKRIISVLLLVCLLASFCTLSAFAAEHSVSTQPEFEGAMSIASNGDTIILGAGDFEMVEPTATITIKYSAGTNLTFPDGEKYEDRVTYDTGSNGGSDDDNNGDGGVRFTMPRNSGTTVTNEQELRSAVAQDGTVILDNSITLTDTLTIPAGVIVTLDLNGKTLSQEKAQTGGYSMIEVEGELKIEDSVGTGLISYKDTAGYAGGYISNTITNRGKLTVSGGTIENNTSGTGIFASYTIDNHSGKLVVNGGYIISDAYIAIRMFVQGDNDVSISGSASVSAYHYAVQVMLASSTGKPNVNLDISGGTLSAAYAVHSLSNGASFEDTNINISGGTFNGDLYFGQGTGANADAATSEKVTISGGTFNGNYVWSWTSATPDVTVKGGSFNYSAAYYIEEGGYLEDGYDMVQNNDSSYSPKAPTFDLQEAVDSAENSSSEQPTVVLPENVNVTVSEPVKVSKNVSIVLADNVFDNDITKTFDGSLFKLAPGATITISNVEGNETELKLMRSLVDEDYCVSHGSIVIKDSHDLGSDGKCKVCDIQVISNKEPTFDLQEAVDSSNGAAINLPEDIVIEESVKIPENTEIVINLEDGTFDNDLSAAPGVSSIFTLGKGASVKIGNVKGTDDELKRMRGLVDEDYCVSKGSIIIKDSHDLGSDGKCKVCDVQVISNTYAIPSTADNSNMPLWGILLVGFAAVALLTKKKKA